MAIINGKVPAPPPAKPALVRRVVVKFKPDHGLPHTLAAEDEYARRRSQQWQSLKAQFGAVTLKPLFEHAGEDAVRHLEAFAARGARAGSKLSAYYAVEVPYEKDLEAVARAVGGWADVEFARVESGPVPPPLEPDDDPLSSDQGYLESAPNGIDARIAWTVTTGKGIGFVDVEQGWTLDHEDLAGAGIGLISGVNTQFNGHGTAVLGEIVGVDNDLGGIGIAPNCTARVNSQWRTDSNFSTSDAIVSAAAAMKAGDVMLIEAQASYPGAGGFVPVEVDEWVFDAIQAAVAKGIVVVEAGANGSVDLDTFADWAGKNILNRNSPDFLDSGAIMVGAASSAAPHSRLDFSNFGSRIDCYAWGENISTSGDGWTGNDPHVYTNGFGGTSGASPMVTGAALLVQSWCKTHSTLRTPAQMRALLSDPDLNTPSADPSADRIGVMPDLRAVLGSLGVLFPIRLDLGRWAAVVAILFGVIQDGGGVIRKPGGGGGPIGPWGPDGPIGPLGLTPEKRDILLGLALTELAGLASDEKARQSIAQLGIATMRGAVEQIAAAR